MRRVLKMVKSTTIVGACFYLIGIAIFILGAFILTLLFIT